MIEQGNAQMSGSELFDIAELCGLAVDYFTAELVNSDADGLLWAGKSGRVLGEFDPTAPDLEGLEYDPAQARGSVDAEDGGALWRPLAGLGEHRVTSGPCCTRIEEDNGRTVLIWDAERIAGDALAALKCRISAADEEEPFRLRFNYKGWAEEDVQGCSAALSRIDQIMEHIADPLPEDVRIDRNPPSGSETSRIRELSRLWSLGDGVLDGERKRRFDELSPHLLIFDDLRYRHLGPRSLFVRTGGRDLADDCIGRPYDYDPAQESYSRSVCREYEAILTDNAPRYDHVCARIQVGEQFSWLVYQRLIAPFRLTSGRPILTVLCDPTTDVNIPFLRGETHLSAIR